MRHLRIKWCIWEKSQWPGDWSISRLFFLISRRSTVQSTGQVPRNFKRKSTNGPVTVTNLWMNVSIEKKSHNKHKSIQYKITATSLCDEARVYPHRYITLDTNTKIYARSFYPNTIRQWNCLPPPPMLHWHPHLTHSSARCVNCNIHTETTARAPANYWRVLGWGVGPQGFEHRGSEGFTRSRTTLKFWSATMLGAAARNFGPVHKFELPTVIADSVPRATRVFSLASVGHVTGHMVSHMVPIARCRPPYWKIFTVNNLATVF